MLRIGCVLCGVFKHIYIYIYITIYLVWTIGNQDVKHYWTRLFFWGLKSTSALCSEDIFFNQQVHQQHVSEFLSINAIRHVECECVQAGDDTGAAGSLGELCEYEIHQGGCILVVRKPLFWHMKLGEFLKDLSTHKKQSRWRLLGNWGS